MKRLTIWFVVALAGAALVRTSLPPVTTPLADAGGIPEPVRGVLHVHTVRSDGSGTVDQVAAAAARAGLQVVIVTDHGDASRAPDPPSYRHGVLVIDAVEITTNEGHLVALGLPAAAPYPLGGEARDVIEDVARLGGLSFAAHPTSSRPSLQWRDWDPPIDGVEWLNLDSEWRDESAVSLMRALLTYPFRRPETIVALLDRPVEALHRWDVMTRHRRVVAVPAADAHASLGLTGWSRQYGDRAALAIPAYEHMFRAMSLALPHLRPSGDPVVDARAVIEEIARGRVYSSIDTLASPARLTFSASRGGRTAGMGDELRLAGPVVFDVRTTAPTGSRVDLLREGQVVASAAGGVLRQETAGEPGAYRVEVHLPGAPGAPQVPWLLSNPIYVGGIRPASRDNPAPVRETVAQYAGGQPGDGWEVVTSANARGVLDVAPHVQQRGQLRLRYALGGTAAESPYVALSVRPEPILTRFDRLVFTARADRPMRLSVQLRSPASDADARWRRSVYLDDSPREVTVRFDDMRPVAAGLDARPPLADIDTVLFVIDQPHTPLGRSGRVWIEQVMYARE